MKFSHYRPVPRHLIVTRTWFGVSIGNTGVSVTLCGHIFMAMFKESEERRKLKARMMRKFVDVDVDSDFMRGYKDAGKLGQQMEGCNEQIR